MKARWGSIFAVLVLAAGCQSTPDQPAGAGGTESGAPFSGFLGDYSQLQPAPDREGVMLFVDKSADYRPYTKVMFDPVQMVVIPSPESPNVSREELARINDSMLSAFRKALEPAYQVVSQPGPDVLRVRAAITGIQAVKPETGVSDYLPIKALYNLGREAAGAGPRVAEMAAEIEILAPNGKRVAAATATRKGDANIPQGGRITWNELKLISDYWGWGLRQRLDELRGRAPQG